MFGDPRLGGSIPLNGPLAPQPLSRERCLAGRATSPHEAHQTLQEFLDVIGAACKNAWDEYWRINYVSAIQPRARNHMPGIVDVCDGLKQAFMPERIRVVQLVPDQLGRDTLKLSSIEIDGLRALDVEVLSIDARRSVYPAEPGNIRILADFFDFS